MSQGHAGAAAARLESTLRDHPDSDEALALLAGVRLDLGQVDQALDLAEQGLAKNPANADCYLVKAAIAEQNSRPETARAAYERYLELAPHGAHAKVVRHILGTL